MRLSAIVVAFGKESLLEECVSRLAAAVGRVDGESELIVVLNHVSAVARERLAPEAVLPYAVVTARNLVSSHARTASRRAAAAPRVLDVAEPERPDDVLLAGEARAAMTAAPRCWTVGMKSFSSHPRSPPAASNAGAPATCAWNTSGYCVAEWLPQIVMRVTSVVWAPALAASCATARL